MAHTTPTCRGRRNWGSKGARQDKNCDPDEALPLFIQISVLDHAVRSKAPAGAFFIIGPCHSTAKFTGRDAEVIGDLPQEVVNSITSARAPSMRHTYALKWSLIVEWCSSRREYPRRCKIAVMLSFLQQG